MCHRGRHAIQLGRNLPRCYSVICIRTLPRPVPLHAQLPPFLPESVVFGSRISLLFFFRFCLSCSVSSLPRRAETHVPAVLFLSSLLYLLRSGCIPSGAPCPLMLLFFSRWSSCVEIEPASHHAPWRMHTLRTPPTKAKQKVGGPARFFVGRLSHAHSHPCRRRNRSGHIQECSHQCLVLIDGTFVFFCRAILPSFVSTVCHE